MTSVKLFGAIATFAAAAGFGQTITIPGGSLTVNAFNSGGTSFVFSGTLTQAATLSLVATGLACEQGFAYCTNAAGVVVIAGSTGVGGTSSFSGTFAGTTANWNNGALLMVIPGVGAVQLFPANAANGLGSATPPGTLALPSTGVTLAALGFPNFSVTNPNITLVVADTNYSDNSGSFVLTPGTSGGVAPAPSSLYLALIGIMAASVMLLGKRGWRRA